jgi:hypothetical protein
MLSVLVALSRGVQAGGGKGAEFLSQVGECCGSCCLRSGKLSKDEEKELPDMVFKEQVGCCS